MIDMKINCLHWIMTMIISAIKIQSQLHIEPRYANVAMMLFFLSANIGTAITTVRWHLR